MESVSEKKEINKIYKSIIAIQKEVTAVHKNAKAHNYDYENLDSIITLLHPHLVKEKLSVISNVVQSPDGKYNLATTVVNADGDQATSFCPLLGTENLLVRGNPMQGMGSAITYARRYNLKNLFNLFSTDDDGADVGAKSITAAQKKEIQKLMKQLDGADNFDKEKFYTFLGTKNLSEITDVQAAQAITALKGKLK